jgi:hypothetical protein
LISLMLSPLVARFTSTLPKITVDWTLGFTHPGIRLASEHWNAVRGQRNMPSRKELKPAAMRKFLRFVNLVDVEPGTGIYRISLQSAHTAELFGEIAHHKFGELFEPAVAQRWRDCFNLVRDSARPVRLLSEVGSEEGFWRRCEVFIAPLSDNTEGAQLSSLFWVFASWARDEAAAVA